MQVPVKPVFKRVCKDGIAKVSNQYCHISERRILLDTGINIPAKYWDKKKLYVLFNLPAKYGNSPGFNREMVRLLQNLEDLIINGYPE